MKKLIVFSIIAMFFAITYGQSENVIPIKTIKSNVVGYYEYPDTLVRGDTVINTFYVKEFSKAASIHIVVDSTKYGGHPSGQYMKATTILGGSLNYTDWFDLDTLNLAGIGYDAEYKWRVTYVPYIRVRTIFIDSTQYVNYKFWYLIEKD